MSKSGHKLIKIVSLLLLAALIVTPALAANIYVKEGRAVYYTNKVFLDTGQLLQKPIIVQYFGENSVSVIVAEEAYIEENDIRIPSGEQFILDQNGKISQRLRFQNTLLDNTLGREIPGIFIEGDKAMVKFDGIFNTLLIEESERGKRRVSLSQKREFDENSGELHLFDGYSLLLDKDNNLEEQVSFRELAFGGTLKTQIDAATSFPIVQPQMPYQPVGQNPNPYMPLIGYNPEPREIQLDTIRYDVPKLLRIGIVPFKDDGDVEGYSNLVPEMFVDFLGSHVEIVILDLTEDEKMGIYLFDRAIRLGEAHNLDGIIQGRIRKLESQGSAQEQRFVKEIRVTCEIEASLVETIGGRYLWKNEALIREFKPRSDFNRLERSILRDAANKTVKKLTDDIITKKVLEGRDRDRS